MIRIKVFLPVLGLVILVSWAVLYKLDYWVKDWMEDGISAITETRTDIHGLQLSLLNSSLKIKNLQVGSSEEEFKNAVEFDEIIVDFQSLPLLQKRFVVDEFSITGVAWGTPRKTSAKLPPKPKEKPSWISEELDKAMGSLKTEFSNLPVAKLTDFKMPTSTADILRELDLASEKEYKEVITLAQSLKSTWAGQINSLRDISEYKKRITQARSLVKTAPNNPAEILKRVNEIKDLIQFFEDEKKKVNDLAIKIRDDYEKLEKQYKAAAAAIESDYNKAANLVSLDQLNVNNLSRLIFGGQWIARAEDVIRTHRAIQAKLKALKADDEEVEVKERAKGRDIVFLAVRKEPAFVLAKSDFSVKNLKNANAGEVSQLYEVKLRDINSSPTLYKKPTTVDVDVSIKTGPFQKASASAYLDHVKEENVDKFDLSFEKIDASAWPMGVPRYFPLKIKKGFAHAKMDLNFKNSDVNWTNEIQFQDVTWDFSELTQAGIVLRAIKSTLHQISNFNLRIGFKYISGKFNYIVSSDLDSAFANAIKKVVGEELAAFKKKLRMAIYKRVESLKTKALSEKKAFEDQVQNKIKNYQDTLKNYQKEADGLVGDLQKKAKKAAQKQAEDQIKKVIPKKLKVPKLF